MPDATLTAYALTSEPVFVQAIAPLLSDHAGITLDDPNALYGAAVVDQTRLTVSTGLNPLRDDAILDWARLSATLPLVEDAYRTATHHLTVAVDAASDPYAALTVMSRALHVIARLCGVTALVLPWRQLTTTPELWLGEHDRLGPDQPPVLTWFATPAMWTSNDHTTSLACTRGMTALGAPEVCLPAAPWEPAQTRDAVRTITANLLTQRVPIQPSVGFTFGQVPVELAEHPDPLTGAPALAITPTRP